MKILQRQAAPLITCSAIFVLLIWLTITKPPGSENLIIGLIFLGLIIFSSIFSAPLMGGMASLTPMVTVAGYLVIGMVSAGWVAFIGAIIYAIIRYRFSRKLGVQREVDRGRAASLAAANITTKTVSILAGAVIYQYAGGGIPLIEFNRDLLLPLVLLGLSYFGINDLIFGTYLAAWEARSFYQSSRWVYSSIIFEGGPLIFSPLIALVYSNLGIIPFLMAALAIMATAGLTRNLAFASHRLERQLKEFESIQEVGQTLSASLDLDTILMTIYNQIAKLMPAELFYIAFYEEDNDDVSFPLVIKNGQPIQWSSIYDDQGLTMHILRTRLPYLQRESTAVIRSRLDEKEEDRQITSWLGVPIIARDEVLGVIAVQSYSSYATYDFNHQEILLTVASQASIAIQNARLYTRTDEALGRRVQELDSILRTVGEGVLLTDLTFKILAFNRALSTIMGDSWFDVVGSSLLEPAPPDDTPLIELIGYSREELQKDCTQISNGIYELRRHIVAVEIPFEKRIERTLSPVRDLENNTTAWLFVLRDVSEEFELTRLREDMMHTLVHDLRSPLAVVKGSLEVIKHTEDDRKHENVPELLRLALIGTERMLRLINNLLDVSRMEDGQMIVGPNWVSIEPLFESAIKQVAPEANRVNIMIEVSVEDDLPPIYVDQVHLERVLNNLLDNAIKFTPDDGQVKLLAKFDPDYTPASILIGVSDTGPGIPDEIQSQLFQKFKQVRMIQGRRTGTGVGLYYCKLAVEAHGGQIWVESQVGRGSTFFIRLPLAP